MIEVLKKYIQKAANYDFLQGDCLTCTNKDVVPAVKMPFFKLAFGNFNTWIDNIKKFFILGSAYSIILSALAFAFGYGYICSFLQGLDNSGVFCSSSQMLYIVYLMVKIFLLAAFSCWWAQLAFNGASLNFRNMFVFKWQYVKFAFVMTLFIVLNFIPVLSLYLLNIRVPNPDWRIEISYFAVVSIGFFAPFILMRFYSVLGFLAEGEKVASLKEIWLRGRGNTLKILLALFLIFLILVFFISNFYGNVNFGENDSIVYATISSEFFFNLIFLIILALWINHCCLQKEVLFAENEKEEK